MCKTIVFVGNPNVGKSTWINMLSHEQFEVGNWPGVSVEKKQAYVNWKNTSYHFIDLPGCYDLNGEHEEKITASFLKHEHIDCIVQVVDVMNLSRNLLLTLLLRELQIPMVLIFNFMDEAEKYHVMIDTKRISARLQIPIVACSAFDKQQYVSVQEQIIQASQSSVCYEPLYGKKMEALYLEVFHIVETATIHEQMTQAQRHRLCSQILQQDEVVWKQMEVWGVHKQTLQELCKQYTIQISQEQYRITKSLMRYVSKQQAVQYEKSKKIDAIILHKYFGIPCFLLLCTSALWLCFYISNPLIALCNACIDYCSIYIRYYTSFLPIWVQDCIVQGILQSVGGVLSFLPLMACFYICIALLEECGYMSRISVLLDRIMRVFHLRGNTVIAFMMGFGCNVAGIYAIRTLEDERQKKRVALMLPFMSCSARLPVYALFGAAFFQQVGMMILTIYGIGIIVALFLAMISAIWMPSSSTIVFEMPPYRKPKISVVLQKTRKELKSYVQKAYKAVFVTMLVIWGLGYTWYPQQESLLKRGAKQLQFLYEPLGFGERWECIAALPTGMVAKEAIVAYFTSLQIETPTEHIDVKQEQTAIYHRLIETWKQTIHPFYQTKLKEDTSSIQQLFTGKFAKLKVFSYLVYILLMIPCVMTLQALRKEFGYKLMCISILAMIVLPYVVSLIIYQLGCVFLG